MTYKAVIGLGFGDEGKGLVTDYLCSQNPNPIVIRFSGGHQAGHTVVYNGVRHVFSNLGSGTLRGIPTYWSKYCTVDPIGLMNEMNILNGKGINPWLFIHSDCPITTPYDLDHNHNFKYTNNGTCGVGFGPTIRREANNYRLHASDLKTSSIFKIKLNAIKDYYKSEGRNIDDFFASVSEMLNSTGIVIVDEMPSKYASYIFEGSQGILLDRKHGFFPNVTDADTDTTNILNMNITPELYLVTRTYQTRHGNGPMTNEDIPHHILIDNNETNRSNKFQGNFRRSVLDLDLLLYAINSDNYIKNYNNKTLVITCLDHVRYCHQYTLNGNLVTLQNPTAFIMKIKSFLGINNVLISKGPESKNIQKL